MSPAPISVRAPRVDEATAVATVQNHGWRQTYSALLPERFYDAAALMQRTAMWERMLTTSHAGEAPAQAMRVAEIGGVETAGELVGVAAAGPAHGESAVREEQLYILYVLAAWHGSGAGQVLLDAVLGERPAQLWVAAENARASRFYQRNGFILDGEEIVADDLEGLREVRMVR